MFSKNKLFKSWEKSTLELINFYILVYLIFRLMKKRQPIALFFIIIFFLPILFVGCGGKKTERELYEEIRSSFKYKTYKTVSEKLPIDIVYSRGTVTPEQKQQDEMYLRILLGYSWAVTKKDAFAFAEADIVTEKAKDTGVKFLAHSINAIMMYENGWQELAKEESALANGALNKNPNNDTIKIQMAVFHLTMGSLSVKDKNYKAARFHFAGFGQVTGINWPYQLVDAMADIDGGDIQKGLRKIKAMSQDPSVPPEIRVILADVISDIEKNTGGNVDSSLFWPKAISGILIDQLKKSGVKEIKEAAESLDKIKQKLNM
jgi:hypothetical protein